MAVTAVEFRKALRHWTSGVTILTSRLGSRVHGMTVSAFTSVSLHPPLVLVCAEMTSETNSLIAEAGVFAANILGADQVALATRFASKQDEFRRFEGLSWREGPTGSPWLPGCLAQLDCRVVAAHDAGDHVIYVGEVEATEITHRRPLVYFESGYYALADPLADGPGAPEGLD